MILLYTSVLLLLGLLHYLVARRAKSLEKKFSTVSLAAAKLAGQPRPGNGGRGDACTFAKHQFELAKLAFQRDKLESKYCSWQHCGDKLGSAVKAVRQWKGRKLPYTFGVVDVSMLLYAFDRLGLGYIDLSHLVEMATAVINR
jgi:hypothetical protein